MVDLLRSAKLIEVTRAGGHGFVDVILASWCGTKVQFDNIYQRKGWEAVPAIANRRVHEIESSIILQPGPAMTDGLDQIHKILAESAAE